MDLQKPYLSINNLSVGYSNRKEEWLFKEISIDLYPGELVCFMGPNGIGKSSLIRSICGLQSPLGGEITFNANLLKLPIEHRLSLVLTDKITSANLTARELITFGRYPYIDWNIRLSTRDEQEIELAITRLKIGDLLNKRIIDLSDGQLQLVMIARALAQNTPIMILDEPTAHLDLNNRVEIMNLLHRLAHETNKAILVATHELDLALQTADNIWLAGKDQSIINGLPEDLVLGNRFDEIFAFKGFDLKTGKVIHEPYQTQSIQLSGDGPSYWWTKNALERNGYLIDKKGQIVVTVINDKPIRWEIKTNNNSQSVSSIRLMLESITNASH